MHHARAARLACHACHSRWSLCFFRACGALSGAFNRAAGRARAPAARARARGTRAARPSSCCPPWPAPAPGAARRAQVSARVQLTSSLVECNPLSRDQFPCRASELTHNDCVTLAGLQRAVHVARHAKQCCADHGSQATVTQPSGRAAHQGHAAGHTAVRQGGAPRARCWTGA